VDGAALRLGERRVPTERGDHGTPRTACEDEPDASPLVEHDVPGLPSADDLLPPRDRPQLVDGLLVVTADGASLCAGGEPGDARGVGVLPVEMDHEGYLAVAQTSRGELRGRMLVTVRATADGPVVSEVVLVTSTPAGDEPAA
jgi:hypothetical protein